MSESSIPECRERIADDDGDPDATVHCGETVSDAYHNRADCAYGPADPTERSRRDAQEIGHWPCKYCVLGTWQPSEINSDGLTAIMQRENVTRVGEAVQLAKHAGVAPFDGGGD